MAGGKKAKRSGTAKHKQALNASPPVEHNTAFIETSGGCERVFPVEVRNTIYRYLLLGRNVKKQRDSDLWNAKGWADFYCFEVNIVRANKAVDAEGELRGVDPSLHSRHSADLCLHSQQQGKSCMGRTHSLSFPPRITKSASRLRFLLSRLSLKTSLVLCC